MLTFRRNLLPTWHSPKMEVVGSQLTSMWLDCFPFEKTIIFKNRNVMLTTHVHLPLMLRMSRSVRLLSLNAFMTWAGAPLPLTLLWNKCEALTVLNLATRNERTWERGCTAIRDFNFGAWWRRFLASSPGHSTPEEGAPIVHRTAGWTPRRRQRM